MLWGFIKFFVLGLLALVVLVAFLSLLGAWGFVAAALLALALLPRLL